MKIDAHHHVWDLSRGDYPWPNETVAPIFRDFSMQDLAPLLTQTGIDKTVLVQATDTVAETEYLLGIAQDNDQIAGVVGWVDLSADTAVAQIAQLAQAPKLVGLRPMLQNIDDTDWILQPTVAEALRAMGQHGLCFDALIQPRHLPVIATLARRHGDLPIVIDHIAKPAIRAHSPVSESWHSGMQQLASFENVYCKLSGMVTEAEPDWTRADLAPYATAVIDAFGPDRVMFGSDWPVVNLASDYVAWFDTCQALCRDQDARSRARIFGETAAAFYGING